MSRVNIANNLRQIAFGTLIIADDIFTGISAICTITRTLPVIMCLHVGSGIAKFAIEQRLSIPA